MQQVVEIQILTDDPDRVNDALARPGALAALLALLGGRACLPGDTACTTVAAASLPPAAGPVIDVPL